MRYIRSALTAVGLACLLAGASHASTCSIEDVSPTAFACLSAPGNDANGATGDKTLNTLAMLADNWGGQWSLVGKSDDAGFGPFTSNPETKNGTLVFDTPQSGVFAVTLKAGNAFNAYLLDETASSLSFSISKELSHATLWSADPCKFGNCPVSPIPEPGTAGLLLAGLGIVGFLSLRRSSRRFPT